MPLLLLFMFKFCTPLLSVYSLNLGRGDDDALLIDDIVDIMFYEMISLSYFIAYICIYNVFVESFLNHILE